MLTLTVTQNIGLRLNIGLILQLNLTRNLHRALTIDLALDVHPNRKYLPKRHTPRI